jgi:hypothetical protein
VLKRHIVCVALEINGIHPTYNVAPRIKFMIHSGCQWLPAGPLLKSLARVVVVLNSGLPVNLQIMPLSVLQIRVESLAEAFEKARWW